MQTPLIRWPEIGSEFRDGGENGMYIMLVVPQPNEWVRECVEESPITLMGIPDAPLSDTQDLWNREDASEQHKALDKAYNALKDKSDEVSAREMYSMIPQDDLSVQMLAAIELGTTSVTYMSEALDDYWQATIKDLTLAGQVLHNTLELAFGITPRILTFLDT